MRLPVLISISERLQTDSLNSIEKPFAFIQPLSEHNRFTRIARQPKGTVRSQTQEA